MKVVYGFLGVAFLAGMIACSAEKSSASSNAVSTGVQGSKGPGLNPNRGSAAGDDDDDDDDSDGGDGGAGFGGHHGDGGAHHGDGGGGGGGGGGTTATPQTCATLAAAAATPAGQLDVTTVHFITPVDVYATSDGTGLTVVLTTTANECGYRANNLGHESVQELQFLTPAPQGGFAPGTFQTANIAALNGQECVPQGDDDDDGLDDGTSFEQGTATGTLTITAINASSVSGTIDTTDDRGREFTFTFTAPICGPAPQNAAQGAACCADPNE